MSDNINSSTARFDSICIKTKQIGFAALALVCAIYNPSAQAEDTMSSSTQNSTMSQQQHQQQQENQELKNDQQQISKDLKQNPSSLTDTQMNEKIDQKIEKNLPTQQ